MRKGTMSRALTSWGKVKSRRFTQHFSLLGLVGAIFLFQACTPSPPATPFVPPKAVSPTRPVLPGNTPVIATETVTPEPVLTPTATPPCTNGLAYINDLTIPDKTVVSGGSNVDKQWLVQNNGSCNWDAGYRLKFVGGLEMGAVREQALYPARAGAQATIRITFTAPEVAGTYTTAWQATDPDGEPFGDAIFMEIIVE